MKAIIYFTASKNQHCRHIAETFEGDKYQLVPVKPNPKRLFFQLIVFGFYTVSDRKVQFDIPEIDFSKYEEVVIVFPVWAGKMSVFMKQYLQTNPFANKKVTLVASSGGENPQYRKSILQPLEYNQVVEVIMYKETTRL